jgi:hypothetical protein
MDQGVIYIFNGRDFVVNQSLPAVEYGEVVERCTKNDPDEVNEEREDTGECSLSNYDGYAKV